MNFLRYLPLFAFVLGYAVLAVIGTRTQMVFQWPSYILFGVAAISTLFLIRWRPRSTPGAFCLCSMFLLSAYVISRAAFSPVSYFARLDIAMVIAAAITYLLFSVYLTRTRYRLLFVGLLVVLACADMVVGLYQIMRDIDFAVLPGKVRSHPYGASGFYNNHNHYGGFLVIVAAFVTSLAFFGRAGVKMRVVLIFLLPVTLAGIAIADSRGSFASLALVLVTFSILSLYLARKLYAYEFKKVVVIAAVVAVTVIVPASVLSIKTLAGRLDRAGQGEKSLDGLMVGTGVRKVNWSLAYDQWQENPIFGQGSRMYDVYSKANWPASMPKVFGDAEFAHNDYLQMLAEYGAVGFGLVALFILVHVGAGLSYVRWFREVGFKEDRKTTDNRLALCLGALALLAGYALHSALDFNLHLPTNLIPVAFAFAVLSNPGVSRRAEGRQAPAALLMAGRLLLPLGGAALLFAGFLFSRGEWHLEKARTQALSEYAEVIAEVDRSLEYDPRNPDAYQLYGVALMSFGFDFDIDVVRDGFMSRAVEKFQRALELNPYDLFSIVGMGRCLDVLGEHDRAEEMFVRAIQLGRRSQEAHYRYGCHLIDRGVDLAREDLLAAIGMLKQAEESLQRARNSNAALEKGGVVDLAVDEVRTHLSYTSEVYGYRMVEEANRSRAGGDSKAELSYLETADRYLFEAQSNRKDRVAELNPVRRQIIDRQELLRTGGGGAAE